MRGGEGGRRGKKHRPSKKTRGRTTRPVKNAAPRPVGRRRALRVAWVSLGGGIGGRGAGGCRRRGRTSPALSAARRRCASPRASRRARHASRGASSLERDARWAPADVARAIALHPQRFAPDPAPARAHARASRGAAAARARPPGAPNARNESRASARPAASPRVVARGDAANALTVAAIDRGLSHANVCVEGADAGSRRRARDAREGRTRSRTSGGARYRAAESASEARERVAGRARCGRVGGEGTILCPPGYPPRPERNGVEKPVKRQDTDQTTGPSIGRPRI